MKIYVKLSEAKSRDLIRRQAKLNSEIGVKITKKYVFSRFKVNDVKAINKLDEVVSRRRLENEIF